MLGNGETRASARSKPQSIDLLENRFRPLNRSIPDEIRAKTKRLLDIGISLILLVVVSPVLMAIAAALKLDSRGPVIFVQERAGSRRTARGGLVWWELRTFDCYKFRSMYTDTDDSTHQRFIKDFVDGNIDPETDDVPTFKLAGDDRVTRVGRFLRRTSLDELPQLVNVLRGDMSLVGPRPVPLYEVAEYESWHYERLAALPGITGIWQVYGRGRVTFAEMMRMDIEYVRRPSLGADLKLLAATLPAVMAGKGAH